VAHHQPGAGALRDGRSRPEVTVAFTLTQFLDAFEIQDDSGKPYILIGGQAVNYWAETYLHSEPELKAFVPFVSKDIDFMGGRGDVVKVARQLRLAVSFPHKKLMTAFAGAALFKIGDLKANIEFVRRVPGVSSVEVAKWAVVSERESRTIRVIDPVSLLACKLNLALTVDQTSRRDVDHVRILLLCNRAFLRETLRGVESGTLPARGWLAATERLLKIGESVIGQKAARKLGVDWRRVLPEVEISASQHPMVSRFRELRLPLWLAKINRVRRP